jgi:hypothetical protein
MRAVTLVFFPDNKGDNYLITSFIHQTLLQNVVLSTPRHEQGSNSQR